MVQQTDTDENVAEIRRKLRFLDGLHNLTEKECRIIKSTLRREFEHHRGAKLPKDSDESATDGRGVEFTDSGYYYYDM